MHVSLSVAEYARDEADGTLTVLHMGLQRFVILDPAAPTYNLFAYIVVLVTFGIEDAGTHELRVEIVNGDGANVIPEFLRSINVQGRFTSQAAVLPVGHEFPPDHYEIRLLWDSDPKAVYPLVVERSADPGTDNAG